MFAKNDNVVQLNRIDTLPPQSIEAEIAVLAGIMRQPEAIARVIDILCPEDFFVSAHAKIYGAAIALYRQDVDPDEVAITDWLKRHKELESVGGNAQIGIIFNSGFTAVNIDHHAEFIIEKRRRRDIIKTGNEIIRLGHDGAIALPDAMVTAEEKVYALAQMQDSDRYQVRSADEMAISLYNKLETGKSSGEKVGWYDLEALTGGIHESSLVVVAAESHMGKSHFMLSYAYEIMTVLNKPVLYVSPEMDEDQVNMRILARITGVDSAELQHNPSKDWKAIASGIEQLSSLPWKVYAHSSPTVSMIASAVRRAASGFGGEIGAVFVDYLQQIPLEHGGNIAFEIGKITRQLRDIAKYHKVPVFLGSQINRGNQVRDNKRPTRHDLRNSGEIYEVCDQLIMLYRNSVYSEDKSDRTIEMIVDKNRISGKLGTATMLADLSTSRFLNLKRGGYGQA